MNDFFEYVGIGIVILCIAFGCSHCHNEDSKRERYEQQTKWLKEHPESYEKLSQ